MGASIPLLGDPQRVRMPGGAQVSGIGIVQDVQHALAPLAPVFKILDAVLALVDVVKAVPGVVANPGGVINAIAKLGPKVGALLSLVPQLAIPYLVADVLDLLLEELRQARDLMKALAGQQTRISESRARAAVIEDGVLLGYCDDADDDVKREIVNLGKRFSALSGLISTFNGLSGIIGGPTIPDLAAGIQGDVADVAVELDRLIVALQATRDAIVLP